MSLPAAENLHAVIMAGGAGTRFWPLSRRRLPKQFLPLGAEKSLLQETYCRLEPLVGAERIWVVTNAAHCDLVKRELPSIPAAQIIGEPVGRNTAPCIGLAAERIVDVAADAYIVVCPADHKIEPASTFHANVKQAQSVLSADESKRSAPWTVTFGIVPAYPATGYGYIQRGEPIQSGDSGNCAAVYRVESFKEKPAEPAAREYVAHGGYYWNSGVFVWRAAGLLELLELHVPELRAGLRGIVAAAKDRDFESAVRERFRELVSVSIDHGVLEKAANVAVIEAGFRWDDVGAWQAVARYAPQDKMGNRVLGQYIGVDSRDCVVVGGRRLIATLGVSDLIIVETDDAVLVCRRNESERVKEIVDQLQQRGMEEFL